jgi:RNA polymerase sigma-70 factor (ECF subfamily)
MIPAQTFCFQSPDRYNTACCSQSLSMIEDPSNPAQPSGRTVNKATLAGAPGESVSSSDEALLARVKSNDQTAMKDLFDRYGNLVYSIALRVLNDTGHAEDLMQDVLFQVWRNPDSFVQGRGSLGAWLAVVARNRAVDVLRKRKPSDPVEDVVLTSKTNLASEVERGSMMEKVRHVLEGLPSEQQKSVELAFFEGLTHAEIAERTGDPLGTVKTRIRTALLSVRKAVQA